MPSYIKIVHHSSHYKRTIFALISVLILSANLSGSDIIDNVYFDITEASEMVIHYTLRPEDYDEYYKVKALISADGGETWFSPKSIRGDIGQQKGAGPREITWDIFSDMDELEGEIQVKVTAKLHQSLFQTIFIPSKNARNKPARFSGYISYPIIDFPNPTYQQNIKHGILEPGFPLGIGVNVIKIPFKFEIDRFIIPFDAKEQFPIYNDMNWSNENEYIYISEASIEYSSISMSISYAIASDIIFFTPFLGLGIQSSSITIFGYCDNQFQYPDGSFECNENGQEKQSSSNKAATSDFFASADLLFNKGNWVIGLSYKYSLIRELRKWNQVQINFGRSLQIKRYGRIIF